MSTSSPSHAEVIDFVQRNQKAIEQAVRNRLRQIGVPDNLIGVQGIPGIDEGSFVRYPFPQGGGNIRPNHPNVQSGLWTAGLNVDEAIFMDQFDALRGAKISDALAAGDYGTLWSRASACERLDAIASHELEELQAALPGTWDTVVLGPWNPHHHAIRFAPDTLLSIRDVARELLRLQRKALGFE